MKAKVDSREPKDLKSKAQLEYGFEEDTMPQADFYLPEKDVAIERKEASDFASSTTEGRLSKQADRMVAEHEHVYIIIERPSEPLYDLPYTNVSDNSLIGMQTSLAVKRGIKIIYTESIEQTLYAVNRIFERHLNDEADDTGYVKTHDTGEVEDVQVAMLMQIDGISEEKGQNIVEKYGIRRINAAICQGAGDMVAEDIQTIDGIGPTLAERVMETFR